MPVKQRTTMMATIIAAVCVVGGTLTGFTVTEADGVNAVDAVAALQKIAPAAVANVAATTPTPESAATLKSPDSSISIPVDPSAGLRVDVPGAGSDVTIGLPFGDQAGDAASSQKAGVVVYDNHNGSSTVPVVHQDGTVQISTVIDSASAPKRYDYPLEMPDGASLELAPDGSAYIANNDGVPVGFIAAPWAKDARGDSVPTHYEVSGDILTQVVDFDAATAFPVVADPSYGIYWWGYVVKFNRSDTKTMAKSTDVTSAAAMCGLIKNVLGSVVCGLLGAKGLGAILAPLYNAARHGNCVQSNQPWAPIPPTLYEVRC